MLENEVCTKCGVALAWVNGEKHEAWHREQLSNFNILAGEVGKLADVVTKLAKVVNSLKEPRGQYDVVTARARLVNSKEPRDQQR